MTEPVKTARKRGVANRVRFSATLNPLTAEKLGDWADEDCKHPSYVLDDVVAFAAKNGFRDE